MNDSATVTRAGPPTPRTVIKTAAMGKSDHILDIPAFAKGYPDDNPKTAVGLTKPSMAGIPPVALIHFGGAMADGVAKYGKFNWRLRTVTTSVYTDAIDRHLAAFKDGENCARDSGRHHLAHVMACCAILLDAEASGKLNDDRGPPGTAADLIEALTAGR